MKWYLKVLNQYTDFNGRARRTEYWMFTLFNLIFAIIAMTLDNFLGLTFDNIPYGYIYLLYAIALMLPGLAVIVRRLHDIGKSGWWILIGIIPLIGGIWLIVLMCTDSQSGTNEYGPNPKNSDEEIAEIGKPLE